MLVYVINKNGNPLMPCKPAKARKLLRDKKAKVVNRCPFTIQLLWDCEENVQEVTIGIDKGSSITGFSCVRKPHRRQRLSVRKAHRRQGLTGERAREESDALSRLMATGGFVSPQITKPRLVANGQILMSGEIHHRKDIKYNMDARRANRRNRRNRKWYRPKRFLNRASSKRSGRLPPSIKANVFEVIRVVRKIPLPISQIVIEDVQVDIARLNNPDLQGKEYQQSSRMDENLRIATLMRDGYQCTQCEEKKNLDAHHIIERADGGKDTIENLITLCKRCHKKVHSGRLKLDIDGVSGFKDRIAQRTMQGKAYLYEKLNQIAPLSKVFGYQTSSYRKSLSLSKEHYIDALCVATLGTGEVIPLNAVQALRHMPSGYQPPLSPPQAQDENFYIIKFRPRQTRRQFYDLPRKGVGRVRYQVNTQSFGFRKGDIVRVKGKWVKQINSIYSNGYLAFARISGEPNAAKPKDLKLLQRGQTVIWERAV